VVVETVDEYQDNWLEQFKLAVSTGRGSLLPLQLHQASL
jgi:hypothetical protein